MVKEIIAISLLAIEIYVEHLQAMSFMKMSPKDGWDSAGNNAFEDLEKLALRFSGDAFLALWIISVIIVVLTFLGYLIMGDKLHVLNKQNTRMTNYLILLFEHVLFGIGFVPIMAQQSTLQYCNFQEQLIHYPKIDCYTGKHTGMIELAFAVSGMTMFIVGVVLPVMKTERHGLEESYNNECYFPGAYKLMLFAIIFLFAPVARPEPGLIVTSLLVAYLAWRICYKNLFVASLRMSVLCGQLWVFIAAEAGETELLIGWPFALAIGLAIMPARYYLFKPAYKIRSIEK